MWTIEQAKSDFSDLQRRARAGEPQIIDGEQQYVVIALNEYERLTRRGNRPPLGRWLVENAPRVGDIELPPRSKDRPIPFEDWSDQELDA